MTDEKKKEGTFAAPVGTGKVKEPKADAEKAENKAKADAEKAEESKPCVHEETERVMFGTNAYEQCMKCNETIREVK